MKTRDNPIQSEKAHEKMEALKKALTKLAADCIIIINRKEENGTLSNASGADIVELMGKTKLQTERMLQMIFSLDSKVTEEILEKF